MTTNPKLTSPALALPLLGLLVLLVGCNVVPTYTPPEYQNPAPASAPAAPVPGYDPVVGAPAQDPTLAPVVGGGSELDEIRIGEKLTIIFTDIPAPGLPPHEVTVSSDGTINLPYNQSLKAAGKSRQQVQQEIRAIYVPSYYRQMSVTIRAEDRFFTVGGEVRNPSRQLFVGTMTVLKAVAAVGGFTEFANKRRVDIIRSNGQKETIDAVKAQENPQQFDVPIYPGDQIYVHRRIL
jgi:polysaccharide export outer membrane protein